jgi:hypothetical protein
MGIGCEASLQTGLSIPSLSALLVRLRPAGSFAQRGGRKAAARHTQEAKNVPLDLACSPSRE